MKGGSGRRLASGSGTLAVHAALLVLLLAGREAARPEARDEAPPLVFDLPAERAVPPPPPEPASPGREKSSGGSRPAPLPSAPVTLPRRPSAPVATVLPTELPAPSSAVLDITAALGELGTAPASGAGTGGVGLGVGSGSGDGKGDGDTRARAVFRGAAWLRRPTASEMAPYWPPSARERRITGRVLLACIVPRPGKPDRCEAVSETPAGEGFGAAAVRMSEVFRVRPVTRDREQVDVPVYIPVVFDPPPKRKPGG